MASKRDPRLALNGSRASVEPEVASSGVASGAARKRSSLAGRRCALCPLGHEAVPVLGPLLQFDLDRKKATVLVHQLCALWAPKAHHSTDPGAQNGFMNVPAEVQRASKLSCKLCKSKGAAMGCEVNTCRKTFHLPCAMIEADYEFNTTTWQVYCTDHRINERGVEGQEMVLLRRELRALELETKRGAPAPASPIAARASPRQQAQQPKQEGQQGEGRQGGAAEQQVDEAGDAMCLADVQQQARHSAQQTQAHHKALLEQQEQIAQPQQLQQEQQGLLQSPGGMRAKQCSHCGAQQAGPPGTTAYNWRRHPTTKVQLCGRCGRYADSHFGQLPPLTEHRQQQQEDHQPDHQQDEVWQQGAAEEQRQGGEVEEEEEEGLQRAAKRPCSSLEQAANYAMDLDAVIALARALHAAPEHDVLAAVQLDAGVVWPCCGGDDAYAQQHEQQQPQQQQQGQQDLLPPAVSELVWDVFGEAAPDAVAAAESYLWAEGVRSFEDLQDCDKQDFAARVPCTKLLCNRFFRLLRERLAERGIPGDAAPH